MEQRYMLKQIGLDMAAAGGTRSDTDEIMGLIRECISDMANHGLFQWDDKYPSSEVISRDIEAGTLYKLMCGGIISGIVVLNEERPAEYDGLDWSNTDGPVLVVHRLAIHPAYQKRGMGRMLMDFAEELAAERGYGALWLDTYSVNSRAIKLYESRGYRRTGQVYFQHRELPFLCFEKVLGK